MARLGPSLVGGDANRRLAPFGRKIGPDPGLDRHREDRRHRRQQRLGHVLRRRRQTPIIRWRRMRLMLADGAVLDTADPASVAAFRVSHKPLLDGLAAIAADTRATKHSPRASARKYRLKNTTGYAINALVDFDDPVDILTHLMIGSEGTLGFLSRVDYPPCRTIATRPRPSSSSPTSPAPAGR